MDENTVAVAPAEPSQGTPAAAAPVTPVNPTAPGPSQTSEATTSAQAGSQAGNPKAMFSDLASAEREYKKQWAELTKLQREQASFKEKFGDLSVAEQRVALMGQLAQDPKFREWAQSRLAESEAGSGDPETVKALEIVRQVAAREAQQMVAPLAAQAAQARLAAVLQAMDRKHPDWRDHQEQVRDTLVSGIQKGMFPPTAIHNLSLEFLEGLYGMTVGLDPAVQAKAYAKDLARKQAATTHSTPGTAPAATASAPVSSMHEALARARKQLGV